MVRPGRKALSDAPSDEPGRELAKQQFSDDNDGSEQLNVDSGVELLRRYARTFDAAFSPLSDEPIPLDFEPEDFPVT